MDCFVAGRARVRTPVAPAVPAAVAGLAPPRRLSDATGGLGQQSGAGHVAVAIGALVAGLRCSERRAGAGVARGGCLRAQKRRFLADAATLSDQQHAASAGRERAEEDLAQRASTAESQVADLKDKLKAAREQIQHLQDSLRSERTSSRSLKQQLQEAQRALDGRTAAVQEAAPEPAGPKRSGGGGGTGEVTAKHLSTKFSSLQISQQTKTALTKGFGYEFMTEVQAATIGPMLAGKDVVARAKTGTGKTLGFLVPMVERIYRNPGGVGGPISALVLSPTRELAAQIVKEAEALLEYHSNLGAACFFGGTKMSRDHTDLAEKPIDILVATPGRMQAHLNETKGFRKRLENLQLLVLDEADQLLDMGFRNTILKILSDLPPPVSRQGALFSATFPAAIGEISKLALRPAHDMLNTVKADDEATPEQIDQCVSITNMEGMTELLWAAVNFEMKRLPREHKIMVFFTTAFLTHLYSALFVQAGVEVLEIHSRKSQAHRTKSTAAFRNSQKGIVFSSDVCARGIDFPNVTTVIQVGLPSSRDQYIHRLGRTGRAGKSGRCILLLHDFEQFFLKELKDLPVKKVDHSSAFSGVRAAPDAFWQSPDPKSACQAYRAWLGYYNSVKALGWPKDQLVREAHRFAESIGAVGPDGLPPPILKRTVGKMGLKGQPGFNFVSEMPYKQ